MEPLRVLVVEGSQSDAELLIEALRGSGFEPAWTRAETEEEFRAQISDDLDLVIADYALPQFDAVRALDILRRKGLSIPFIVVTGTLSEETADAVMKRGADDYLLKDRLGRLGTAVKSTLQQRRLMTKSLRTQQSLMESEQRFQIAFEHAPNGMAIMSLDGRFLSVNPALCKMLGYSAAEMTGMSVWDITHPDDLVADHDWLEGFADRELLAIGRERRNLRKDGGSIWVTVNRSIVRDLSGAPWYYIGQAQDITERRQAELRVRRLSRLYAAISEANAAIVRSRDQNEVFRAVCHACVLHGGFSLAWVGLADGQPQRIRVVQADGPAIRYLDEIVIATGSDEVVGRGPTGIAFREQRVYICNDYAADLATAPWQERAARYGLHSSIALPLYRDGRAIGAFTAYGADKNFFDEETVGLLTRMAETMSFAMDQFDREERRLLAEAALKSSEARLQQAQVLGQIGDWELDLETSKFTWSPEAARLLEHDPAAALSSHEQVLACYLPDSGESIRDGMERAEATGARVELEGRLRLPSGREAWHAMVIVPVADDAGRVTKLQGTVQDVTERKLQEAERASTSLRLAELSSRLIAVQEEERRRLAAELHDSTSPNLAAIMLNFEMLCADLPPEMRQSLDSRLEDTRALLADTSANIREICADLRPALLDYAGLLPALEGYVQQFASRTGTAVNIRSSEQEVRLSSDKESLLFRIVQEALANCAKHANATTIEIELSQSSERTVMSISDDGRGFDLAALGRLGAKPGLGLLTMKERAEFAGGRFKIVSRPGEGTRITVELRQAR